MAADERSKGADDDIVDAADDEFDDDELDEDEDDDEAADDTE